MAVIVTDLRTVLTEADNTSGWTNVDGTSSSVFAEASASVIQSLNISTGQLYFTSSANNLTDTLLYVYSFNNAIQGTWTANNPPNALHIGDGSNRVSFKMAGGDRRVFNHLNGPTEWQCLVLELNSTILSNMNSNGLTTVRAGSFGALNTGAITQVGADFTTQSKALGGGFNVAVDIIRFGNNGIRVTGGSSGDRGTFLEIVQEDRSTANQKAHGIIRELGTGLYGLQGPINFGNAGAATNSWFEDTSRVLSFENRNISNDRYFINVEGNSGATNHFVLRNSTITSAGPWVGMTFNSGNINTLELTGMTFSNLGNRPIVFSSNADASGHILSGSSFAGCGQVTAGAIEIVGCNFSDQAGDAIMLLNSGSSNISNTTFNGNGAGPNTTHGILITTPGTYDFNNLNFVNFGANDTTSAAVYNNSGGEVIINVFGGSSPTVRNGAGATTIVNNPTTLTVVNVIPDSEVRIFRQSDLEELGGVESADDPPIDVNNVTVTPDPENIGRFRVVYSYNHAVDIPIFLVIFKQTRIPIYQPLILTAEDSSFFATQVFDRQFFVLDD